MPELAPQDLGDKPQHKPVFSWTAWPDQATCNAAAQAMMTAMEDQPMPDMPFDGARMMWGGFEVLFDSAKTL